VGYQAAGEPAAAAGHQPATSRALDIAAPGQALLSRTAK